MISLRVELIGTDRVGTFGLVEKALEGSARRNTRDAKTSRRGEQVIVEPCGIPIAVMKRRPESPVLGKRAFGRENLEWMNASEFSY